MIEIRKIEKEELLGDLFETYKQHAIIDHAGLYPESPPLTDVMVRERLMNNDYDINRYFAICDGQMIGHMRTYRVSPSNPAYEQNKYRVGLFGFVLPAHRNKGLGSKLAKIVLGELDSALVGTLRTYAYDDSGVRFATRLGGQMVNKDSLRKLEIGNVDWNLVESWKNINFPPNKKPIMEFHKDVDKKLVDEIFELSFAISVEISELDNNEFVTTRESEEHDWKEMLEYWEKIGFKHDCFTLKDNTGSIIGYTMCMFNPDDPEVVGQAMTSVWKHLRGNGYGKFLKALMLENIRNNHPQIKRIETQNNDLNDPMVYINEKLGFVVKSHWYSYKIDYNQAMAKLKG